MYVPNNLLTYGGGKWSELTQVSSGGVCNYPLHPILYKMPRNIIVCVWKTPLHPVPLAPL